MNGVTLAGEAPPLAYVASPAMNSTSATSPCACANCASVHSTTASHLCIVDSQHLVDHDRLRLSLDVHHLALAGAHAGSGSVQCSLRHGDDALKVFCHAFQARSCIHRVADRGVVLLHRRTDAAAHRVAGVHA